MAYIGRTPTNAALTAADLADGIVSTVKIAADAVTDAKIADDVVGTEHLTANEVDTAALGADAVTGAQLADNAVNSEHYTDGSIDTAHIADVNVTEGKIADNAITLAKMASGTDGNIISYDASGNPVAIATGSDGQVLTSTGAGSAPAFETPASATNTPAFARDSGGGNVQVSNKNTWTLVTMGTAIIDTDSDYTASTGKFLPSVAGNYLIYGMMSIYADQIQNVTPAIYRNGSEYMTFRAAGFNDTVSSPNYYLTSSAFNTVMNFNGSSDYIQMYINANWGTGSLYINGRATFGAIKIIE
jgi:hypothetical protein